MRNYSNKRRRSNAKVKEAREAYQLEFVYCMACGQFGVDVHEISSGVAGRPLSVGEPATWLALCRQCNGHEFTDKKKWPTARQLALKLTADPERFDLAKFNAAFTLGSVLMEDIAEWLELRPDE